jgi:hypothetical protein
MAKVEPFPLSFRPANTAVELLARIASGDVVTPQEASDAVETWRKCLAAPGQIGMVDTSDELEVDDDGACVSEGDTGFFIQTWSWVYK